jgi:membrane-bound lytic murein transglycosylase D
MKKTCLIATILLLCACQTTPKINTDKNNLNQALVINTTSPQTILPVVTENAAIAKHRYDDVWLRIRSQLTIEVPDNKEVAKWRDYYLSHPNFMVTISQRAEPFLYYIVEEIEKRGMPLELALLPIVESSYIPYGVSHMSAAGLWQFMPISAKRFNIEQNWWYDGRRDVVESTRGALDYFQFFHNSFKGDWLNAVAAFNSGEGRVGRAIKKNRKANLSTDFWSLNLPNETTHFVPKLLAIADILKRADELNYTFTPIKNSPAIAIVNINSQLDISLAAKWAEIDAKTLFRLNPGLNRWATAPDSEYQLMIPYAAAQSFKNKLAGTNKKDWLLWHSYQIKSGDNLSAISNKYATNVAALKKLNQLKSDTIHIGQRLIVPLTDTNAYPLQLAKLNKAKITHTVKSGDNLWDISRKYKVKVQDIIRWNKLTAHSLLHPKQKLKIRLKS